MDKNKISADILAGGFSLQGVLFSGNKNAPEWLKARGLKMGDEKSLESVDGRFFVQKDPLLFDKKTLNLVEVEEGVSLMVGKKNDVFSVVKGKQREKLAIVKGISTEKKSVTAYVSTQQWDRYDERFSRGAWVLDEFKKNPVVMWAHDYKQPPIGKAVDVFEDEKGLIAETIFNDQDEFAMKIFSLYERGFMNAFSVGFDPFEWMVENIDPERKGLVYTKAGLLEYSAVPIPANPGALVPRGVGELCSSFGLKEVRKISDEIYLWGPPAETPKDAGFQLRKLDKTALEHINKMARTIKGNPVEKEMLSLIQTTMDTFQDIINDNVDGVSKKEVEALHEQVRELGKIVWSLYPDAGDTVSEVLRTIDAGMNNL